MADLIHAVEDIRQSGVVKDMGDSIAHIEHCQAQTTGAFIRAAAWLVSHLADTADGSERAIQDAHDLTKIDLFGGMGQVVSATDTHLTLQQAGILQSQQDLFEKLGWDLFAFRNLLDLNQTIV